MYASGRGNDLARWYARPVAVLTRRRRRPVALTEVPVERRAPILRRDVEKVPGGRPHIPVAPGASIDAFVAIADRYPVFEVRDVRE